MNNLNQHYKSIYQQECSSFIQRDRILWPQNSQNGASKAQQIFNMDWEVNNIVYEWRDKMLPDQYQYQLYSQMMPYVFLLVLIIVCIFLCCCQVFCIPKYKVFMRCCYVDIQTDTKSNIEKYVLFFSILIIGFLLCTACLLSYEDEQIEDSLLQIKCISLWMISSSLDPGDALWRIKWTGSIDIDINMKRMDTLLQLNTTNQSLQYLSSINVNSLRSEQKIIQQLLSDIYLNYYNYTLVNPNPYSNQKTIQSKFVNELGPPEKLGSISNSLLKELFSRQYKLQLFQQLQLLSNDIQNNNNKTINQLNIARKSINNFTLNFIKFLSSIEESINKKSWIIESGVQAYKNYLKVICIIVVCLTISFSLVTWSRFQKLAFLLHISWISLAVSLVFGFMILGFVYYISIIDNNMVCAVANTFLDDETMLNKIIKLSIYNNKHFIQHTQFYDQARVCLYYQGDLNKYFQLTKPIKQILDLRSILNQTEHITQQNIILKQNIDKINYQLSNYGEASTNNTNKILHRMNLWSDSSLNNSYQLKQGNCQISQDEWVWNIQNCHKYQTRYASSSFEFGMALCFQFDDYDDQFAKQRYQGKFNSCSKDVDDNIIAYYESIKNYIQSIKDVLIPIKDLLHNYSHKLQIFDLNLSEYQSNISLYGSQMEKIFEEAEYINETFNCSYVREGFTRFKNTFCVTLLNGLFLMYIYLITICSLLCLLSCIAVWSAMRCIPKYDQHLVFLEATKDNENDDKRVQKRSFDI